MIQTDPNDFLSIIIWTSGGNGPEVGQTYIATILPNDPAGCLATFEPVEITIHIIASCQSISFTFNPAVFRDPVLEGTSVVFDID